jgi:hypothetical protein
MPQNMSKNMPQNMPPKQIRTLITGATLATLLVAGAQAVEPPHQGRLQDQPNTVIYAPAPEAVLVDPGSIAAAPRGADQTLQIDSFDDGGTAVLQFGFTNGEIGAVTYNIDPALFPVKIKKVQIYWSSALANGTQSLQDSVLIYTGNFNLLANLEGPVMIDGGLNEFDLEPLNIIIANPTSITVGLQFFEGPNGNALMGTLATDDNGCQSNKNWVFVSGTTWFNLCSFGVAGDLVIRTIIDPMGAPVDCPPDVNGDGMVDTADLGLLIANFGQAPPFVPSADVNDDGVTDTADLGILISAFGTICP